MDAISGLFIRPKEAHRALLVSFRIAGQGLDHNLDELAELARSAGLATAAFMEVNRHSPHPRSCVGTGKVEEIRNRLEEIGSDTLLIDWDVSATQQRNLEAALEVRVLTRTELIIYIFSRRARTREGRLQVELAALRHAQTRLSGGWSHLDRQRGGVNLRGVGESQLAIDRRLVAARIRMARSRLERVERQRETQRKRRMRSEIPIVALVGYTNAGKSTLFNRLSDASVYVDNRLFATLDATMRKTNVQGIGNVLFSDTVGFIRNLPVNLIEAFKSTLEEVSNADLLLHVIDASAPDFEAIRDSVVTVLRELSAEHIPMLEVFNKIDRSDAYIPSTTEHRVAVSAVSGKGIDDLMRLLASRLGAGPEFLTIRIGASEGKTRSWLYDLDAVVGELVNDDGSMELKVRIGHQHLSKLATLNGISP